MGLKDISFSFQRTYAGFSFLFSWNRAMRFNGLIPRKENNTSKSGLAGVWCDQYLCLTGRTAVFCCDTPTVLTVYIFKMSTGQTLKLTMRNYTFTVRYILDNVSVTFHTSWLDLFCISDKNGVDREDATAWTEIPVMQQILYLSRLFEVISTLIYCWLRASVQLSCVYWFVHPFHPTDSRAYSTSEICRCYWSFKAEHGWNPNYLCRSSLTQSGWYH